MRKEDSLRISDQNLTVTFKKLNKNRPPISYDHYLYISKNMIDPHIESPEKFAFDDLNLILKAFEFYEYEKSKRDNF